MKLTLLTTVALIITTAAHAGWGAIAVGDNDRDIFSTMILDGTSEEDARTRALARCRERVDELGYRGATCKIVRTFGGGVYPDCYYTSVRGGHSMRNVRTGRITRDRTSTWGIGGDADTAESNCRSANNGKACKPAVGGCVRKDEPKASTPTDASKKYGAIVVGIDGKHVAYSVNWDRYDTEEGARNRALTGCRELAEKNDYKMTCKLLDTFAGPGACGFLSITDGSVPGAAGIGRSKEEAERACAQKSGGTCKPAVGGCHPAAPAAATPSPLGTGVAEKTCGYGLLNGATSEETVAACTIIAGDDDKYTKKQRAIALLVRGNARYQNADDDAKNLNRALEDLNASIKLIPSAEAYLIRGLVFASMFTSQYELDIYDDDHPAPRADADRAIEDFTQVQVRDELVTPAEREHFIAEKSLAERAYAERGMLRFRLRDWKNCVKDYESAEALSHDVDYLKWIGDCSLRDKNWDLAIKSYQLVVKETPEDTVAAEKLVEARKAKKK
jgi:tetratricopeptide (TPR) repeat protein